MPEYKLPETRIKFKDVFTAASLPDWKFLISNSLKNLYVMMHSRTKKTYLNWEFICLNLRYVWKI